MTARPDEVNQVVHELDQLMPYAVIGERLDEVRRAAQDAHDTGSVLMGYWLDEGNPAQARLSRDLRDLGRQMARFVSARRRARMSTRLGAGVRLAAARTADQVHDLRRPAVSRQPSLAEELEARRNAEAQRAERDRLQREQGERERAAWLRQQYAAGEPTPAMERLTEKLQWLHDVMRGGWRLGFDAPIPSFDRGEFHAATAAAKAAVEQTLAPMIVEAEAEYAEAERERERIIRGR